jgi:hypothetical protein
VLAYARHAVPWGRVGAVAALVVTLMELVRRWPWETWALQGLCVALLAGAAAWCFDEPAAAVVDAAPRTLAWRTTGRAAGPLLLVGVWLLAVRRASDSLFGHAGEVALQGVVAALAATAWVAWRRSAGDPDPGNRLAVVVVPATMGWVLVRPLEEALPLFPYAAGGGDAGNWGTSLVLWCIGGLLSAGLLVAALADLRWWRWAGTRSVDSCS